MVYIPWWLKAPIAAEAPANDFEFIKSVFDYSQFDNQCSTAAQKSISRHLWYLTEELLPFCLFSNKTSDRVKETIATKMTSSDKTVRYSVLFIYYVSK